MQGSTFVALLFRENCKRQFEYSPGSYRPRLCDDLFHADIRGKRAQSGLPVCFPFGNNDPEFGINKIGPQFDRRLIANRNISGEFVA